MEKRSKIEAVNGEIRLPEAIIQHIQSFLSGKQAAQTSALSKSWYSAWLTRPNLVFDQRDFDANLERRDELLEFAKKTMQRYDELNLKIQSFRLCANVYEWGDQSLGEKLIVKAMEIGAIDLNLELMYQFHRFVLPYEVLESKTLIRLSLTACTIFGMDVKVCFSRLKSLSLHDVYIQGDIVRDMISSCPLIEELSLSKCWFLSDSESSDVGRTRSFIEFGPIHFYEFRKLNSLLLEDVNIDTLLFDDFSSKFPCLKELTLRDCVGYKGIRISSCSLEFMTFKQKGRLRAEFDVPRIRKFNFSGRRLPSLSFETASREWDFDISISCYRLTTIWFLKLKEFLTKFSLSKISLLLDIESICMNKSLDDVGDIQCLPKPVVENLTMRTKSLDSTAIWDGLFWSCRPKFITLYMFPKSYEEVKAKKGLLEVFSRRLTQVSQNCCVTNQDIFGQCDDLEEVNVEILEENVAEWRPLPWKTLLDASTSSETEGKIRFWLRWGQGPTTFR